MAIANKTFPPLLGLLVFQAEDKDSINLTVKFIISFQIQL